MNYAMKAYGGMDVYIHIFLNFGTSWEWSVSRPGRFIPEIVAIGLKADVNIIFY
jgi:hypothetical protein